MSSPEPFVADATATNRADDVASNVAKRAFDVVVSGVALILMSPLLIIIAAAVRGESRGPAMFRQERVGRFGRNFRIHKFRSMRVDAGGPMISTTNDLRLTRIGPFLRRSKLDELPQLLDVLRGTMSLVGPRPEVPEYVAMWPDASRRLILSVRPGITDPASVLLSSESDVLALAEDPGAHYESVLLPLKVSLYEEYVRDRSFLRDLAILIDTARKLAS